MVEGTTGPSVRERTDQIDQIAYIGHDLDRLIPNQPLCRATSIMLAEHSALSSLKALGHEVGIDELSMIWIGCQMICEHVLESSTPSLGWLLVCHRYRATTRSTVTSENASFR